MADVPDIDAGDNGNPSEEAEEKLTAIELRLLDAGAKAKENINREADQRYRLRWLAVIVCVLIIIGMGCMLGHVVHKLMSLKTFGAPSSYIIALYVVPILSMTTLSIALLVAAFRGFKDGDGDTGVKAMSETAKVAKIAS